MIKCAIMSCFLTNPIKIRVYSFDQMNEIFKKIIFRKNDFEQKRFKRVIAHFFCLIGFFKFCYLFFIFTKGGKGEILKQFLVAFFLY